MALIAKAEKKLKGMFSFGNGKFEEAAELYGQAAKQYQLAKNCAPSLCAAVPYRRTSRHAPRPARPPRGFCVWTSGATVERPPAAVAEAAALRCLLLFFTAAPPLTRSLRRRRRHRCCLRVHRSADARDAGCSWQGRRVLQDGGGVPQQARLGLRDGHGVEGSRRHVREGGQPTR